MTTTTPIFTIVPTPTDESTFFTDLDTAIAAANEQATAMPGQEFLVLEARESVVVPVPAPVDTPIEPQV